MGNMRLLWSLLTALPLYGLVAAEADPEYSIGLRKPISDDRRTIPGFQTYGSPQFLSDRIILTPPAPGNQRVGVWSKLTLPYDEFSVDTEFRVSGGERAGGSFHIWYTARGGQGGSGTGTDTVYTSKPWDGLALVVDSYEGVGSLRAYLNDGQLDYSHHHKPGALAFAHCDFSYRNWGVQSHVKLTQAAKTLKVEIDGKVCFETDKARVPKGYYLGITAATSDPPDSFELFSLVVDSPQKGNVKRNEAPKQPNQQQQQQQQQKQQQQQQQQQNQQNQQQQNLNNQNEKPYTPGRAAHEQDFEKWKTEPGEEDHEADFFKTQEEQFQDVHNRLQGLTHHLATIQSQLGMIYDKIDGLHHKEESMRAEYRGRNVPREQIDRMETRIGVIENLNMQIANAITSKDYSHQFENLHKTLREHHSNLLYAVPDTVTQVLATGGPKIGMMLTIVVLFQIALAAAYIIYKRRRNSSPKKYL
ncbi:concanavalin A-like lectin/glucanase domain-containing protein [Geopyxis carbonaria]|nr:concanavalin A-like lectin/glucanase domain-containing protein [Geopyxis carbonaria]